MLFHILQRRLSTIVHSVILYSAVGVACSFTLSIPHARAADGLDQLESIHLEQIQISGLGRTKEDTILRLLPRQVPADYSRAEVNEFERRIRNLSLFDLVRVEVREQSLTVEVQEKFTLSPIVNFTSGSSVKDLNATGGLVEYNLAGTGTQLGGQFSYSQRGPNVDLWIAEHAFQPDRWAKEVKASYSSNGIRFPDSLTSWTRNRIGGEFELKGPYAYGSPLRYEIVFKVYREQIHDPTGTRPADGTYVGIIPELTWDRYHWHDLVPSGYRLALELRPGYFFGADQPRHEAKLRYLHGTPLATSTVLMINSVAEAVNRSGNPNHSLLLGSIAGVRGLSDNLFRNRAQAYANIELRHAIPFAARWALQGVLFSDVGAFQAFTEEGTLQNWKGAVNVGGGLRVIPTFLANTLFRIDVAQLMRPNQNTLIQFGITQYF